jgi:hypothetical protein
MVRDIPDVVAPVKTAETSEDAEGDEDEGEQPILGHVSMATDLVRRTYYNSCKLNIFVTNTNDTPSGCWLLTVFTYSSIHIGLDS